MSEDKEDVAEVLIFKHEYVVVDVALEQPEKISAIAHGGCTLDSQELDDPSMNMDEEYAESIMNELALRGCEFGSYHDVGGASSASTSHASAFAIGDSSVAVAYQTWSAHL